MPVVNIGTRQQNRLRGQNVIDAGYGKEEIKRAIVQQLEHGNYVVSPIYYQPDTSSRIAKILANTKLHIQKSFFTEL